MKNRNQKTEITNSDKSVTKQVEIEQVTASINQTVDPDEK